MIRALRTWLAIGCAILCAACAQQGGRAGPDSSLLATQAQAAADNNTDARRRAKIRLELSVNYFQQKQLQTALEEVRQAIAVDPNYADAYSFRALILFEIGETRDANTDFQKALSLAPQDPDINNNYGWFLCQTGEETKSIQYFVAAARNPLYQTPAKPMQNAGICSMRVRDWRNAELYLIRSFELDQGNVITVYNLSLMYMRTNDLERAGFYADRLNKMIEPTAESLWLAIRIAHKRNESAEKERLATQLRRRFLTSREWAAYLRGAFDE
jgi:type IV pilus assembly protein PilF